MNKDNDEGIGHWLCHGGFSGHNFWLIIYVPKYLMPLLFGSSLTRLGDLLYFGRLLKAQGKSYFAQIANTFQVIFVKVSKSFIILENSV